MTISNKRTGDLYLQEGKLVIDVPEGTVDFTVAGHTQGLGGDIRVELNGRKVKTIHVPPCRKVKVYGEEFFGEYGDHPKRETTPISFRYPERK